MVARCGVDALAHGVVPGMGVAEARALLPDPAVRVEPFDEAGDLRALRALSTWALRFAPTVALDPPDGLLLDVTGCRRLFGGERAQLDALVDAVQRLGWAARACVAGTVGCAWAVARYGREERRVVAAGEEQAALVGLPVRALRVEDEAAEALREVGVESVGELLGLSREELAARFGAGPLLRLDQALGEAPEPLEPERPQAACVVERTFDGPVTSLEAVLAAARALLDDLARQLRPERRGVRAFDLTLQRVDVDAFTISRELARPTLDAVHLWTLVRPAVERAHLGFGVEGLSLRARRTAPLRPEQATWTRTEGPEADGLERAMAELLDTLAARFGAERILKAERVESYLPESAVHFERACADGPQVRAPLRASRGSVGAVRGDRPSLLLDQPEPIEVELDEVADLPREVVRQGRRRPVTGARGPERLAGRWWEADGAGARAETDRDYFVVALDDGRRLWIYRSLPSGAWRLHGEWA